MAQFATDRPDIFDASNLVELLRFRATFQPEQLAFTFLSDGETEADSLTYQQLDRRSQAIAARLQALGMKGERALLLYPPGLDYLAAFLGCLYAGVVAVPAYPPRNQRNTPRIQAIVEDAGAAVALTTTATLPKLRSLLNQENAIEWLTTDLKKEVSTLPFQSEANPKSKIQNPKSTAWEQPAIDGDTLAFLQYTSGSTGTPKGVMLSHGNLMDNAAMTYQLMEHSPSSKFVSWLPMYHDMGLIGGILQPLYGGFPCILMPPTAFLQRPYLWLQAISKYGGTTSGAPNFAYQLCVEKITPEQRETLDLSSWSVAFNGAEPIRHQTLERFAETFASCGFKKEAFYPCYGMAEATLMVSGGRKANPPVTKTVQKTALEQNRAIASTQAEDTCTLVGCGQTLPDREIAIVNPDTLTRCLPGEVGEIWVSGSSVGKGYWNRSPETKEIFEACLSEGEFGSIDFETQPSPRPNGHPSPRGRGEGGEDKPGYTKRILSEKADPKRGTYLRTGDLGFLADGELFITGRAKDLIIIRGRNLYPQDIELTAERSHRELRSGCSAAFAVDINGEESLVVVQELQFRSQADVDEVTQDIREAIAQEYEIQPHAIVLIQPGTIPKTSSGKIQRRACRDRFLAGELEVLGSSVLEIGSFDRAEVASLNRDRLLAIAPEMRSQVLVSYLQAWAIEIAAIQTKSACADLGTTQSLLSLGLDSLKVFELKHQIESDFGVEIAIAELFDGITLAALAEQILDRITQTPVTTVSSICASAETIAEYPLSFAQQRLWFLDRLEPGNPAYNIAFGVRLQGELNVPLLEQSLQAVVQRHEALRTKFITVDDRAIQAIDPSVEINLPVVDIQHLPASDREPEVQKLAMQESQQPFDLSALPLFRWRLVRVAPQEHVLLLTLHHIISDARSAEVLVREMGEFYSTSLSGQPSPPSPLPSLGEGCRRRGEGQAFNELPIQYKDFAHWQQQYLEKEVLPAQLTYWKQQLDGAPPILSLPTDYPRPAIQTYRGSQRSLKLPLNLIERLKLLADRSNVTLFMLLLAAFQTLLYRYTRQKDIVVGSPIANRDRSELKELIGFFVNTLVLRTDLSGNPSFLELLARLRQVALAAYERQDLPFDRLVAALQPQRDLSYTPLFQVMFDIQNAPLLPEIPGLTLKPYRVEREIAQFDLNVSIEMTNAGAIAVFEYNTDLFAASTIDRMLGHFQTLLEGIIDRPETRVSYLPLLTESERLQLLGEWSGRREGDGGMGRWGDGENYSCIHKLFEKQVERTPNAIAVVFEEQQLSYKELNSRADRLAHYLQTLGVQPEVKVGICVERSLDMVVALLGVLKAGGAYVPLDPAYPQERLAFMLSDSQVSVLLTQSHLIATLPKHNAQLVCLDRESEVVTPSPPLPLSPSPHHLAYVIYTSGSTGTPKGVGISHRSLVNHCQTVGLEYEIAGSDRLLQFASLSFDVAAEEIFPCLVRGATLVLRSDRMLHSIPEFLQQCGDRGITVLNLPTAFWHQLMAEVSASNLKLPPTVRLVIIGSEQAASKYLEIWQQQVDPQVRLVNCYGVTETTISAIACDLPAGEITGGELPIGKPMANVETYVLDSYLQPVPIGVPGEIYIGGAGLARGYLDRPEQTALAFIPHPYSAIPGARLYKTGDLGRYRLDGNLEFLGRIDRQVKVRGFRIELGEIETVLRQHPEVKEAVVIDREDIPGDKRLVAYVVPNLGYRSTSQLREYLQERLLEHMLPSWIIMLASLPLNPNGKVDRQKLPAPERSHQDARETYVAPQNQIEKTIASIWQEALQLEKVGINDNFFDLGGHSLLALQVQSKLQTALNAKLSITDIFKYPNISSLANYLSREQNQQYSLTAARDRAGKQKAAIERRKQLRRSIEL